MPTARFPRNRLTSSFGWDRMLFDQGRYPEALDAYRNAVASEDSPDRPSGARRA